MNKTGVVLFFTTSSALRSSKLVSPVAPDTKLIPTPRQFSSNCGFSLRFPWNLKETILEILTDSKVEYDCIHEMVN